MVVLAFAAAGCGGDDESSTSDEAEAAGLDTAPIESTLESTLGDSGSSLNAPSGPAITGVSCPDEVEAAAGTSFDCDLSGEDGLSGTVTVTLEDDSGAEVKYKGEAETSGFSTEVNGTVSTSGS
jgi:hypothetical protein